MQLNVPNFVSKWKNNNDTYKTFISIQMHKRLKLRDNLWVADLKSSYLYENLPVQAEMAILSRTLILLAILLFEQFIHHTQINLRPNKQLLSTQQQHAYQSFLSYFLL